MSRALLVAIVLTTAACGDASAGITAVTVDSASTTTSTTSTTTTTPVASVPAAASALDLRTAAAAIVGPSTDLRRQLAPIVTLPDGIPTPMGTKVSDFSVHAYNRPDELDPYVSIDLTFTSSATVADLQTFFETKLRAAGYTRTGYSTQQQDKRSSITMTFRPPAAVTTFETAEVSTQIIDSEVLGVYMRVEVTDRLPDGLIERLSGWAGRVPGVEDLHIDEVHISTVLSESVSLGVGGTDTGRDAAGVLAAVQAGLPTDTYALNPKIAPIASRIDLLRDGFYDFSVEASDRSVGTEVSIRGAQDFVPAPSGSGPSMTTTTTTG